MTNIKELFIKANLQHIYIETDLNMAFVKIDKELLEFAGCKFRPANVEDIELIINRCAPVGELKRLLEECEL